MRATWEGLENSTADPPKEVQIVSPGRTFWSSLHLLGGICICKDSFIEIEHREDQETSCKNQPRSGFSVKQMFVLKLGV